MDAVTKDADIIADLEALCAVSPSPDGYYTVGELADMLGIGKVATQRRLKVADKAGRLECTKVKRKSIDGRMMLSYAYRILPA